MTDSLPFASRYGGTFATEAERDAWDTYREARIEASLKSPVFSRLDVIPEEERDVFRERLIRKLEQLDDDHPLIRAFMNIDTDKNHDH